MPLPNASEQMFDALGNAERRRIVRLLAQGPLNVGAIASKSEISRPAISRHLKVLESARLVRHRAEGNRNFYTLDPAGFDATRAWLDAFWNDAEQRLRFVAENVDE